MFQLAGLSFPVFSFHPWEGGVWHMSRPVHIVPINKPTTVHYQHMVVFANKILTGVLSNLSLHTSPNLVLHIVFSFSRVVISIANFLSHPTPIHRSPCLNACDSDSCPTTGVLPNSSFPYCPKITTGAVAS